MNQKFEKFKSKQISKQDSEKVVGGDYLSCLWDCDLQAWGICSFGGPGPKFWDCVIKETMKCSAKCVAKEMDII